MTTPRPSSTERDRAISRPAADPEVVAEAARMLAARRAAADRRGWRRPLRGRGTALAELAARVRHPGRARRSRARVRSRPMPGGGIGGLGLEGNPAANAVAGEADVVICCRDAAHRLRHGLAVVLPGSRRRASPEINVTAHDARKQGAVPIVADAREARCSALRARARAGVRPRPAWETRAACGQGGAGCRCAPRVAAPAPGGADPGPMTQGQLIGVLKEAARPGDTIIAAAGGPPGDLLKSGTPPAGAVPPGVRVLVHGLRAAGRPRRAARPARRRGHRAHRRRHLPDQPGELVTARQEGLKITVVIAENHGFQVSAGCR